MKKFKKIPRIGPADNLDWSCNLFMRRLLRNYRSHKAEITSYQLTKLTLSFEKAFGIKQKIMLDALFRRGWLEPSAADTYVIRYDLMRQKDR